MPLRIERNGDTLLFWIHVTPRARRPGVGGQRADALRVAVSAPPLQGRANAACAQALADALGLRSRQIGIDPGARGRRKAITIAEAPPGLESKLQQLAAGEEAG